MSPTDCKSPSNLFGSYGQNTTPIKGFQTPIFFNRNRDSSSIDSSWFARKLSFNDGEKENMDATVHYTPVRLDYEENPSPLKKTRTSDKVQIVWNKGKGNYKLEQLSLCKDYWIERAWPEHPEINCVKNMEIFKSLFKKIASIQVYKEYEKEVYKFYQTIDPKPKFIEKVTYEEQSDNSSYLCTMSVSKDGSLVVEDVNNSPKKGNHLRFVIDLESRLYVMQPKKNHCRNIDVTCERHSTPVAGEDVLFAGGLTLNNDGTVQSISSDSGHYKPSNEQFVTFLLMLREMGADLEKFDVKFLSQVNNHSIDSSDEESSTADDFVNKRFNRKKINSENKFSEDGFIVTPNRAASIGVNFNF